MYDLILKNCHLLDSNIINVYPFGSRIYKTDSEESDYDFVIVANTDKNLFSLSVPNHKLNIHIYSQESFKDQLNKHKIVALECYFLPKQFMLKNSSEFQFKLNENVLRSSIEEKIVKDLVKAKKRLELEELGDNKQISIFYGKKSFFHAIRTIDFGSQIIKHGKIIDYSSCNDIWFDIITDPKEDWDHFNNKFKGLLNISEFKRSH